MTCKKCTHYEPLPDSLNDGWCRFCNEATSADDTCDWHTGSQAEADM